MTLVLYKDTVLASARGGATTATGPETVACVLSLACAKAQGLPDGCLELETLRSFRDGYLRRLPEGPALIAEYYATSPRIVTAIESAPDPTSIYQRIYEEDIVPCVRLVQEGQMEAALARYAEIMAMWKATYLGE